MYVHVCTCIIMPSSTTQRRARARHTLHQGRMEKTDTLSHKRRTPRLDFAKKSSLRADLPKMRNSWSVEAVANVQQRVCLYCGCHVRTPPSEKNSCPPPSNRNLRSGSLHSPRNAASRYFKTSRSKTSPEQIQLSFNKSRT